MLEDDTAGTKLQFNIALVFIYVLLFILVALSCFLVKHNQPWLEFRGKKVLLITAHPDDECMFFGPVISATTKVASSVSLLCLTKGNYYNQGDLRKQELMKSCKILGINNVTTLDNKMMMDDPYVMWNERLVSEILIQHIRNQRANAIITFDNYGVSGHKNHISIYNTMKHLVDQRSVSHAISVYTLDSVMLLRKYIFIFDLLWSFLTKRLIFVSGLRTVWRSQQAMAAHETQYMWYRRLYIMFSRYMIINTLTQIWGDESKAY